MKRRTFLKACAGAGLLSTIGFTPRVWSRATATAIRLGNLPLLFVDDAGIERGAGVRRTFHAARTLAEPVLTADRPWEKGRVYIYGTVLHDPASDEFRMWYGTPKPSFVLQATSKDGLHWKKPSLGVVEFDGSFKNNIVLENVHSPSILFDPLEPNPQMRYKLIGAREHIGYLANYSPDGLHWTADPRNPVMPGDDTLSVTRDPDSGDYLLYHKRQIPLRGHVRRTVWLSRSQDFQNWSKPQLVFAPNETDDQWTKPGQRTDVYNMSVFPHAAGFVGLPTMFHVERVRPKSSLSKGQAGDDGPIFIQLATSRDGVRWNQPASRPVMIPLGAHGDFDRGAMLGSSNHFVHHKEKTWLYYTALNTTHGAPIPPKQLTIGRAEWRLHGLASLDAADAPARIETRLLSLENSGLSINADASRGSLRVGLADENGVPLPGFEVGNCLPLRKNATHWKPSWKSGAPAPVDCPVRIVVEMENASLFSVSAVA